jgi:hypothetical protein
MRVSEKTATPELPSSALPEPGKPVPKNFSIL